MKVLVTGGCGYTGTKLVQALLELGHEVTVLDLMLFGRGEVKTHPLLKVVEGDIRNQFLLRNLVKEQQAVFHLSFISNDPEYNLPPAIGEEVNIKAFQQLVLACNESGVEKFIFPSSCSIYGNQQGVLDEDSPALPLTNYAIHKQVCEDYAHTHLNPDIDLIILRPATVFGPSPRLRLDLTVNQLAAQGFFKKRILVENPHLIRPGIYIEDLIRLYIMVLTEVKGRETFNAGFYNYSMGSIALQIGEFSSAAVSFSSASSVDCRSYSISSDKLGSKLGFETQYTLMEGVQALANVFNKFPDNTAYLQTKYYNLQTAEVLGLRVWKDVN